MKGIECSKCGVDAHGGTMKGKKFVCRSCEDIANKKARDEDMKKQVKEEEKKLNAHMKKNKNCICRACKGVKKQRGEK